MTAELLPLRGSALGHQSTKALSKSDSAAGTQATREADTNQQPAIAGAATGARKDLRKERPWTARAAQVALRGDRGGGLPTRQG